MVTIRRERASDIPAREALLDEAFGADRAGRTCERLREGRLPALALVAVAAPREIDTARERLIRTAPALISLAGCPPTDTPRTPINPNDRPLIGTPHARAAHDNRQLIGTPCALATHDNRQLIGTPCALAAHDNRQLIGTVRMWHVRVERGPRALLLGPLAVARHFRRWGVGGGLVRRALCAACAQGARAVILLGDAAYYGRFGFSAETTAGLALPGPFEPDRLLARELVPGALAGARGLLRATGAPAGPVAAPALAA